MYIFSKGYLKSVFWGFWLFWKIKFKGINIGYYVRNGLVRLFISDGYFNKRYMWVFSVLFLYTSRLDKYLLLK